MITHQLIERILSQYQLPINGIHGISHWARVLENGRLLARDLDINKDIIELFAVFHDSKRVNDMRDKNHGERGAQFAHELRGQFFDLSDDDFSLLKTACCGHTDQSSSKDLTIQICWDADRLDLGRAFIKPDPKLLCIETAKNHEIIKWAYKRSLMRHVPGFVKKQWGYDIQSHYPKLNYVTTLGMTYLLNSSHTVIKKMIIRCWMQLKSIPNSKSFK